MGDLQPDNGGVPPDDSGSFRGGLPDMPPEWGTVVIPDNAAELDAEATVIRRELRRQVTRTRLRALVGLGPGRREPSSLGIPIVIMAVAVITTLLSLFVVTWDHRRSATEPVGPDAAQQTSVPLADVSLPDASGKLVRLADVLPALLLLVEEDCDCAGLIRAIAAAAPPVVTVIPVSTHAACPVGTQRKVLCLADPAGTIISRYPTTPKISTSESAADGGPTAAASASAAAADPSFSPPVPVPKATAVPVDGNGVAGDPIKVTSADDVADALATLATSE